jgi:hypothetical protein
MNLLSVSAPLIFLFPQIFSRQNLYASLTKNFSARNFFSDGGNFFGTKADEFSAEKKIDSFPEFSALPDSENFYLTNSGRRLKRFEFGEEKFLLSDLDFSRGKNFCVTVNDDTFSKTVFNENFLPVEKIVWRNGKSLDEAKILSRKKWNYSAENFFVSEENFSAKKIFETSYDKNKNPVLVLEFQTDGGEEKKQKILLKKIAMAYDAENRIVRDEEFFFDEDAKISYRKKSEFFYTEKSSKPDTNFFENGRIRFSEKYSAEDSFEKTLFFDEGFSVRLKYENGEMTEEKIITENGEKF